MKKLFLLVCTAVLLFSCQKEEPKPSEPTEPALKANYLPLKTGNYWVYQRYHVDTFGNETLSVTDSVIVKGDTIIRNNKYYVLENFMGNAPRYNTFLRDSSEYIVNEKGVICFSATNFTDILSFREEYGGGNLIYTLSYKMEKVDNPVTVPAGIFEDVLDFKGTAILPQSDGSSITKEINNQYAKNVGKIFEVIHYANSSFSHEKRKLIRYYVQ
jgi:hypothetical protein